MSNLTDAFSKVVSDAVKRGIDEALFDSAFHVKACEILEYHIKESDVGLSLEDGHLVFCVGESEYNTTFSIPFEIWTQEHLRVSHPFPANKDNIQDDIKVLDAVIEKASEARQALERILAKLETDQ